MLPQIDNKILTSFLLQLDNKLQSVGAAYQNASGLLYPVTSRYNGYTAYATPYKQLCNDTSVSGASIMSGVYLNRNFVTIGQSGLVAINHYDGTIYFNNPLPNGTIVSGNYAIKDFSVEITNQPEQNLLFLTKYVNNNAYNQTLSGLDVDTKTCPAIFLKTKVQENKPFALGGIDENKINIRGIVVADTEYKKIAALSIIKTLNYRPVPYIASTPFDSMGNMTGLNYNYNNLSIDPSYRPWILGVRCIDVPIQGDFKNVVQNMAMFDVTISTITSHDF